MAMSAQRKPEPSAPNEAPRGLQREHAALVARSLRVLANATRLQLLSGILGAADGRATVRTLTERRGRTVEALVRSHVEGLVAAVRPATDGPEVTLDPRHKHAPPVTIGHN